MLNVISDFSCDEANDIFVDILNERIASCFWHVLYKNIQTACFMKYFKFLLQFDDRVDPLSGWWHLLVVGFYCFHSDDPYWLHVQGKINVSRKT